MLTRPLTRGLTRPLFGSEQGWIDPLADIPFALRLQTHRGDGVPFELFQDIACTIPATQDGHLVAAWRGSLGPTVVTAIQPVIEKRPILRYISSFPVLETDGIDDFMIIESIQINLADRLIISGFTDNGSVDNAGIIVINPASGFDYERSDSLVISTTGDGKVINAIAGFNSTLYEPSISGTKPTFNAVVSERWVSGIGGLWLNETGPVGDSSGPVFSLSGGGITLGARYLSTPTAPYLKGYFSSVFIGSSSISREIVAAYAKTLLPS